MTYLQAWNLIKSDFIRYYTGGGINQKIRICLLERGFKFSFWWRLDSVRGFIKPLTWIMHRYYSTKYNIQIGAGTRVGPGFQICHGTCVIINGSAIIGKNVTIHQFLTIGSEHHSAAVIGDNVVINPDVSTIENVHIGNNSVIGAGAIVTHDIPPFSVAVGCPARVIKHICNNENSSIW